MRGSHTDNDVLASSERSVSFSTIEFHEHAMIMGVSPSTTHGPPLEIDWEKMNSLTFDVDEYEELRPPRRVKEQLIMPGEIREEMLLENGYTRNQINHHIRELKRETRKPSLTKIPILALVKIKRSFLGGHAPSKGQNMA